jgi:hypothetical protein
LYRSCKSIKAEVERAASMCVEHLYPFRVGRINADGLGGDNRALADEYGVDSVPTFFLFHNPAHVDRSAADVLAQFEQGAEEEDEAWEARRRELFAHGPRAFPVLSTAESMLAGMAKMTDAEVRIMPVKQFGMNDSSFDVASWIFWRGTSDGKIPTTAVLYTPPFHTIIEANMKSGNASEVLAEAQAMRATFDRTATQLLQFSNLRFASVDSDDIMMDFELPPGKATLVIYTDHDEGRHLYTGPFVPASPKQEPEAAQAAVDALQRFILTVDIPLVTTVWHKSLQSSRKRVNLFSLFFVSGRQFEDQVTLARITQSLQGVASALEARGLIQRGNFTIAVADGEKYASWMKTFGLNPLLLPALALEDGQTGLFYRGPLGLAFESALAAEPNTTVFEPVQGAMEEWFARTGKSGEQSVSVDAATGSTSAASADEDAVYDSLKVPAAPEANAREHKPLHWASAPAPMLLDYYQRFFAGMLKSHGKADDRRPVTKAKPADKSKLKERAENGEEEDEAADSL